MEASALTHASQRGLLARRSPLLKLQGDERLIAMARGGNAGAFETIVDRYQGRLLGFCRQMLGSTEDAEDVLQEVFVNAYRAMLADEREINLRPWLYRIARNRCLNHLRKPTADAQESMDMVPAVEASSTAERVHNREEFRQLLIDVRKLPETQRSALLLREMDALSYEEIAQAMDTSVPSVKSLLVRARISLAEANQARQLTCGEVRLELAEAVEGLRKISGPVRRHVRECEGCADFRSQVRSNEKALAALAAPVGPLLAIKGFIASKLGLGGAGAGAGAQRRAPSRRGRGGRGRLGRRRRTRRRRRGGRNRSGRRGARGQGRRRSGDAGGIDGRRRRGGRRSSRHRRTTARRCRTPKNSGPGRHRGSAGDASRRRPPQAATACRTRSRRPPPVNDPAPTPRLRPPTPDGDATGQRGRRGDAAATWRSAISPADAASDAGTHSGGAIAVVTVGGARRLEPAAAADSRRTPPPARAPPRRPTARRQPSSTDPSASTSSADPPTASPARRTQPDAPHRARRSAQADHFEAAHQAGAGELARVLQRVAEQLPVVHVSTQGGESTPSATGSDSSRVRWIAFL